MSTEVKVLQPEGILDEKKSVALREQVKDLIEEGYKTILIDFQQVNFMDSFGLGTLILIRRIITEANGKLFLMSLNKQVEMLLFDLTNTGQYFDIVNDESELQSRL